MLDETVYARQQFMKTVDSTEKRTMDDLVRAHSTIGKCNEVFLGDLAYNIRGVAELPHREYFHGAFRTQVHGPLLTDMVILTILTWHAQASPRLRYPC
jgi:hypothetical protein